jgi:hypothetical protein
LRARSRASLFVSGCEAVSRRFVSSISVTSLRLRPRPRAVPHDERSHRVRLNPTAISHRPKARHPEPLQRHHVDPPSPSSKGSMLSRAERWRATARSAASGRCKAPCAQTTAVRRLHVALQDVEDALDDRGLVGPEDERLNGLDLAIRIGHGRGHALSFLMPRNRSFPQRFRLVGRPGLEPGTYGLKVRSSTD